MEPKYHAKKEEWWFCNVYKGGAFLIVRVAAFGSEQMIQRILEIKNTNIEIVPYMYETPEASPSLVKQVESNIQVLLFTGPIPFFFAQQEIKKIGLPAVYVPFDELNIALSLYYIRYVLQEKMNRISIDIPNANQVYNVFRELKINSDNLFVRQYAKDYNTDQIVAFHYDLWKKKKVEFVLTSVRAVYLRLQALGINSLRMIVPEKNIQDAMNDAMARGELAIRKGSQIAVGLVSIDNYNEVATKSGDFVSQEVTLQLHQILLRFGKQIDASILHLGKDQFIIYGTRGGLSQVTNQYSELHILSEIKKLMGITITVGFGFGFTAREAEQNANIALYHAKKSEGNKAYVVTDEKKVIGPLNDRAQQYFLRSVNQQILSIAEKTGISISNLSKIQDFLKLRKASGFSSGDLADYLQVSKRSAERLLKKLLDNKIAEIVGEEQPYQKGRPRSIYKIKL
jgi:GGDEF domain-containing protein